jgi:hypothetical protein
MELIMLNTSPENKCCQSPVIADTYLPLDPKYLYQGVPNSSSTYTLNNSNCNAADLSNGDGLDSLMFQRQYLILSKIGMLYSDIYDRHRIKEQNLYRINLDQCAFRTLIYQMWDFSWDNKRTALERQIVELENEKRRQEESYFKDILFLKKELRQSLIEKQEEEHKARLLLEQPEVRL